ncbi:MAG: leucine-rich repeat protein [Clostridia bacterium]|nr:leucine-rich repeat protein [Clostridia bacterium]
MRKYLKLVSLALFLFILTAALALTATATEGTEAATPTSGYVVAIGGGETNIKWEVVDDGTGKVTLSFNIDPAATDKKQTTVLYGANATTGKEVGYNGATTLAWGAYKGQITHVSVGDGITEINGGIANSFGSLLYVELPTSLVTLKGNCFQGSNKVKSIYYRGNEAVDGEADISTVTTLGNYILDNCKPIKTIKLSEALTGALGSEVVKMTAIKEFTIPAGVTAIGNKAFISCGSLEQLWCYATEYTLSDNAFDKCEKLTYVYGIPGTPLEEYCRTKDISFRNINNPDEYIYKSTKEPEIFDPAGATAYGQLIGTWNGSETINTYWIFYEDTKTLEFFSNKTGWNETGNVTTQNEKGETTDAWKPYSEQIEHVVVGKGLKKVSQRAFEGMTALKSVELGPDITQIDMEAFQGCSSLTTVYRKGNEPVEGTADLTGIAKISDRIFEGSAVEHFIFAAATTTMGANWQPNTIASIKCTPNDEIIAFAVEYYVDVIDIATGETVSKNYVFVDRSLPSCGNKTVFNFDEATGTLTVSGVGPMGDIVNYYGGGSKTQWWFDVKQQIKKVIIQDGINYIGKYAFTQCKNIEYVELPATAIDIGNAAFEECENLKSIYLRGNDPIIGHLDLSNVPELTSWCFSKCYLIANVTISPEVAKIGSSVFDTCPNLAGVYGTPASFAEEYAADNGFTFTDASSAKPVDTVCEKPAETTEAPETTAAPESDTALPTDSAEDTAVVAPGTDSDTTGGLVLDIESGDGSSDGSSASGSPVIIIIAVVAVVVVAAVVVIVILKKKKK